MSAPCMLILEARLVYGQVKLYPANPRAEALAAVLGTKTIDIAKARQIAEAFEAELLVLNEDLARKAGLYR